VPLRVSACADTSVFISCVWECMSMTEQKHLEWRPSHLFYSVTILVCLSVSVKAAGRYRGAAGGTCGRYTMQCSRCDEPGGCAWL